MGRHQIVELTGDGELVAVAGTGEPGYTNGALESGAVQRGRVRLPSPTDGVLFVADEGNHVIRRVVLPDSGGGTPGLALAVHRERPREEGVRVEVFAGRPGVTRSAV